MGYTSEVDGRGFSYSIFEVYSYAGSKSEKSLWEHILLTWDRCKNEELAVPSAKFTSIIAQTRGRALIMVVYNTLPSHNQKCSVPLRST